jgi:hypothetical protein
MKNKPKFKVGDKLKPSEYHQEESGLKFVTITEVNEEKQVYHWSGLTSFMGFRMVSGTFFKDAEKYEE